MLIIVIVILSCFDFCACQDSQHDEFSFLLGYNAEEAAFFYETFDKRRVRERAATLDPPPLNCTALFAGVFTHA